MEEELSGENGYKVFDHIPVRRNLSKIITQYMKIEHRMRKMTQKEFHLFIIAKTNLKKSE